MSTDFGANAGVARYQIGCNTTNPDGTSCVAFFSARTDDFARDAPEGWCVITPCCENHPDEPAEYSCSDCPTQYCPSICQDCADSHRYVLNHNVGALLRSAIQFFCPDHYHIDGGTAAATLITTRETVIEETLIFILDLYLFISLYRCLSLSLTSSVLARYPNFPF